MFSIIIPTLLKDTEVLNKLLYQLNEDSTVGEIIIIDNSCSSFKTDFSKVKVHVPKENLFVNPAWNLGIKLSSPEFKYFGILNDDIIFQKNLFEQVHAFLEESSEDVGLVGIDCVANTSKNQFDFYPENTVVNIQVTSKLEGFFGSAFFGNKKNYFEIPNEMKVFYGDHFLFTRNIQSGHKNYKICNIGIKHLESLSSHSSPFIAKMFKKDRKLCIKHNGVEHQHLSILQRIFSITTYHNHYVFSILGLKMKFKIN
ncbi:Glycosyl transferase family 2 [Succinivibrio dextrinosolvens DSM 3072]|uniref:Glycosyl transferase family 2 n=1 Tax=Succinivibrio dextrinosolvens DSM 3072 TaxID=1123324 RepID=A0A1T4VBT1_9GAMM|nr:glycosyltransferase [Succinivibrio dextrinosolvens]SKA62358.1 Glycosyl transferase family 2 [Succinivibrio dextrinosolvens DSM 3072]